MAIETRRRNWSKEEVIPIGMAEFVGGMIGARVSMVLFHGWGEAPVAINFFALFDPRIGPGSILGGVVGGYLRGYIASKAIGKKNCTCYCACDCGQPDRLLSGC